MNAWYSNHFGTSSFIARCFQLCNIYFGVSVGDRTAAIFHEWMQHALIALLKANCMIQYNFVAFHQRDQRLFLARCDRSASTSGTRENFSAQRTHHLSTFSARPPCSVLTEVHLDPNGPVQRDRLCHRSHVRCFPHTTSQLRQIFACPDQSEK